MSGERAQTVDVVVVGAGVVGAATARALAKRGASVAVLEQGELATAAGSSRGTSRIFAPAAYPDESYLRMGLDALEEWRALEQSAAPAEPFLNFTGALCSGSAVDELAAGFEAAAVEFERVEAADAERRFGISGLGPEPLLFQPGAGVIRADRARGALLRAARDSGVQLYENEQVTSLEVRADEVEVRTAGRAWRARRAVVTAGPWAPALLAPIGIELPLRVSSQALVFFPNPPPGAEEMPALIEFDGDEPYAMLDPVRGLKVALHRRGPEVDPGDGRWGLADEEGLERATAWARARFPGLGEQQPESAACLYTNTPDERFILERRGPIVIGSPCSGHGFQLAPANGERLAELATD